MYFVTSTPHKAAFGNWRAKLQNSSIFSCPLICLASWHVLPNLLMCALKFQTLNAAPMSWVPLSKDVWMPACCSSNLSSLVLTAEHDRLICWHASWPCYCDVFEQASCWDHFDHRWDCYAVGLSGGESLGGGKACAQLPWDVIGVIGAALHSHGTFLACSQPAHGRVGTAGPDGPEHRGSGAPRPRPQAVRTMV